MVMPGLDRVWGWLRKEQTGARKNSSTGLKKLSKCEREYRRRLNNCYMLEDDCTAELENPPAAPKGLLTRLLGRRSEGCEELPAVHHAAIARHRQHRLRLNNCYMLEDDCSALLQNPPAASKSFLSRFLGRRSKACEELPAVYDAALARCHLFLGDAETAGCGGAVLLLLAFGVRRVLSRRKRGEFFLGAWDSSTFGSFAATLCSCALTRWQEPRTSRHVESTALPAPGFNPEVLLICAPPGPREGFVKAPPSIPAEKLTTPWSVSLHEELLNGSAVPGLVVVWHEGSMTLLMLWFTDPYVAEQFLALRPEEADLPVIALGLEVTVPDEVSIICMASATSVSSSSASPLSAGEDEVLPSEYCLAPSPLLLGEQVLQVEPCLTYASDERFAPLTQQQAQAPRGFFELDGRLANSSGGSGGSGGSTGPDGDEGGDEDEGADPDFLPWLFAGESGVCSGVGSVCSGVTNVDTDGGRRTDMTVAPLTPAVAGGATVPTKGMGTGMGLVFPAMASRPSASAAWPCSSSSASSTASMSTPMSRCSSTRSAGKGEVNHQPWEGMDGKSNGGVPCAKEVEDRAMAGPDEEVETKVRLLTKDGPNLDMFEPEGESEEGGFAEVSFFKTKGTGELVALKTGKNTAGGKRQILTEIDFLRFVAASSSSFTATTTTYENGDGNDNGVRHIVAVKEMLSECAVPKILMRKEPRTLRSIQEGSDSTVPAGVVKVLDGVLAAVGWMFSENYLHRDIKPENILVSEDGDGILADFGLVVRVDDAGLPKNIGAGTADYSAVEVFTTGSVLPSELFSVATCFTEMMIRRCPFNGEELVNAGTERRADLAAEMEILMEKIEELEEDLAGLEEEEGGGNVEEEEDGVDKEEDAAEYRRDIARASSRLEEVRRNGWRLGVRSEEWQPDAETLAELSTMEPPLEFLMEPPEGSSKEEREDAASARAKNEPVILFRGEWLEWLPDSTMAPCKEGLVRAIQCVLDAGMLSPHPEERPQTVKDAKELLQQALSMYEEGLLETEETSWEEDRSC
eukprot:g5781.t1